jgi:hypothetical protein
MAEDCIDCDYRHNTCRVFEPLPKTRVAESEKEDLSLAKN